MSACDDLLHISDLVPRLPAPPSIRLSLCVYFKSRVMLKSKGTMSSIPGPDPASILEPPDIVVVQVPPPTSLKDYTEEVEQICRKLDKEKVPKAVLCIAGGRIVAPGYSAQALKRWELALAKLQKRNLLLVAALDGPLCDLSLSLALACDFRLATCDACLPAHRATERYVPLPIWWLASIALHAGVLRAQQLLWRSQLVDANMLVECNVVHHLCESKAALTAAHLPVPSTAPLALMRRIVLQAFSISGNDIIGHSLAVNSLVIVDAVGRAATAFSPLPPLLPLGMDLKQSDKEWVLTMTAELERVSLDELAKCVQQVNKSLCATASKGAPLPNCLILRLDALDGESKLPMPAELLALKADGSHFNMKLVRWLTKFEKTLTTLATLPLPTVCVLGGSGTVCSTALQIAFACDLRAMQPGVTLDFGAASGVLPGTLAFRLAKHVGTGVAMAMLAQEKPVGLDEALEKGVVQLKDSGGAPRLSRTSRASSRPPPAALHSCSRATSSRMPCGPSTFVRSATSSSCGRRRRPAPRGKGRRRP